MKKKKLDRPILAEGEITGHAHVLETPGVDVFDIGDGMREFQAMKSVTIVHEEHAPIECPPSPTGDYVSGIVQEFDVFAEEARNVQD
jgi:hypothetical protein